MGIHSDLTTMFEQDLAIHPTPVTFGDEPDSRVRPRLSAFFSFFYLMPSMIGTIKFASQEPSERRLEKFSLMIYKFQTNSFQFDPSSQRTNHLQSVYHQIPPPIVEWRDICDLSCWFDYDMFVKL